MTSSRSPTKDGQPVWVHRPPHACPNGHVFRAGDNATTYGQGWYGCWCDGAQCRDARPGHVTFTCKSCGTMTLMPECTNPSQKIGWAASHWH
jgi:hypothetical protein